MAALIVYSLVIVLASLGGGAAALFLRLSHRWIETLLSLVAGVMLGISLLHLIPHAMQQIPPLRVGAFVLLGLLTMFFLERFFCFHHHDLPEADGETSGCGHGHHHGHGHAHHHDHGRSHGNGPGHNHVPAAARRTPELADRQPGDAAAVIGHDPPPSPTTITKSHVLSTEQVSQLGLLRELPGSGPDGGSLSSPHPAELSDRQPAADDPVLLHSAHHLRWGGAAVGLTLHALIEGVALAAATLSLREGTSGNWIGGFGIFLVIVLHKPFDALTLGTLMTRGSWPRGRQHLINLLFGLAVPLGAVGFVALDLRLVDLPIVGFALAFSGGAFLCISLSDLLPELQFHQHDRLKLSLALLLGLGVAAGIALLEQAVHNSSSFAPADYEIDEFPRVLESEQPGARES